jgi:hypothetical protein
MPVTVLAVLAVTAIGANAMHGRDPAVHRPFVLRVSPTSRTVQAGSTARCGIRIHRLSIDGRVFAGRIKLRIRGLPRFARARIIFRKRSRSRATLTMITSERTPTGRYRLRLRGIGGGFGATIRLTLNISVPRAVPVRISGSVGGLMPGVPRALDLSLTNSYRAPVSVTGLRVVVGSMRAPRSSALLPCSLGDFFVQQFRGSYPLRLPPSSTRSLDSLGVAPDSQPQIMLVDSSTNQDGCQGATLTLAYTGTALEP